MTNKIIVFFAFFLSISFNSFAQISKGDWLINGSISLSDNDLDDGSISGNGTTTANEQKSKSYNFSPKVAYLLSDRLSLGLSFGIFGSTNERESLSQNTRTQFLTQSENKSRGYSISPFIRYYQPIKERFGFYGQVQAGYRFSKHDYTQTQVRTLEDETSETISSTSDDKVNSYNLALSPGVYYFLTKRLSFEIEASLFRVSYAKSNYDRSNSQPEEEFFSDRNYNNFRIHYDLSAFAFSVSWYLYPSM